MKKIIILLLMLFLFNVNINAANKNVEDKDTQNKATFDRFRSEYEKGIQTTTVNSMGTVTLYGFSDCSPGSCTFKYANTSQDFKEVLKRAVICAGGEKNIIYQTTGGADGYKTTNAENYDGLVYWTEDFDVTCTNTASSSTIALNSDSVSSSGIQNPTGNNSYDSSSTTDNPKQGVETYYIILLIVGASTYMLSNVIKKQNLFKKI